MRRFVTPIARAIVVAALAIPFAAFPAAADAPAITRVLVIQVVGNQQDRYVAGKDAIVAVGLDRAAMPDDATQKVVITRDGAAVATLKPTAATAPFPWIFFACPSRADCGDWKAGTYAFDATVGAATGKATAKFQERGSMHVFAVPVKANYGPGDIRTIDDRWKKQGHYTRRVYPLAPENFKWTTGPELDLSADKYNLRTNEGMFETWKALAELVPAECRQTPKPAGVTCYDKVVGFVAAAQGAGGNIAGYTMGSPANVVTTTDQDAEATVAHEIAHIYKVSDEYGGGNMGTFWCFNNQPPASFIGRNGDTGDTGYSCTDSKTEIFPGVDGALFKASVEFPYEIGGRGILPDFTSFMADGGALMHQIWISGGVWKVLFDALAPKAAGSSDQSQAATRYVTILGAVDQQDKVDLMPWSTFTSTRVHTNTTGKYTARALDASGKVLATVDLKVLFQTLDTERSGHGPSAPILAPEAGFEQVLPFSSDTAKFEIVKGTTVLKTITPSKNAPVVTVTAPAASESVKDGPATIKWSGSDADGDKLEYLVEYSVDGKTWIPLKETSDTQITEDFSSLPGTGKAESRIRVTATDGVFATQATGGMFTATAKAPIAVIDFPLPFDEFEAGSETWFEGIGIDLKDDEITADSALVWTSSLQGQLGTGELLALSGLKVGEHQVTLETTNSLGLKGKKTVTITVHPGGRTVTLADVYAIYNLYLGRNPVFGIETPGWIGMDFGEFVSEVRKSEEAEEIFDLTGYVPSRSAFSGLPIKR